MNYSYASIGVASRAGLVDGHKVWFGMNISYKTKSADGFLPDDYLVSTAKDMSHYLIAQLNGGTYDGVSIISADSLSAMQNASVHTAPDVAAPFTNRYGFGLAVGTLNGQTLIAHDGDTGTFHSNIGLLPQSKTGVVILVNQNGALLSENQIFSGVIEHLAGLKLPSISHSVMITYAVIDVFVVLTSIMMIRSLWKMPWRRSSNEKTEPHAQRLLLRRTAMDVVYGLVACLAIFYGLGFAMTGAPLSLSLAYFGAPDITIWLLAIIGFFPLRALLRIGIAFIVKPNYAEPTRHRR